MHSLSWGISRCQAKHCQYAEEIASFLHQNPQRNLGLKKLYYILSLYERWWIFVGKYRSEPFEKIVLHYITERTFWSDITDGDFVAKLLVYLYQADNHFAFFLCPDQDYFPSLANFNGSNNHLSRFFLNHAYRQHLTISGKRIADLEVFCKSLWLHPCEMAVILESPDLLHLLLQYGALITDEIVSIRRLRTCPRAGNMLIITMCVIKTMVEIFHTESLNGSFDVDNPRFLKIAMCGRFIVRASPQFEKNLLGPLSIQFPGFTSVHEALNWVAEHSLPELSYRIYHPAPLKHTCRLKIRKLLHDNWQLPFGIDKLPLPTTVIKYLNLHFD